VTRYFDLEEAQGLIPLLRERLGDALQLHSHLRRCVELMDQVGVEVSWELLRSEEELEGEPDEDQLQALVRARMVYQLLRDRVEEVESMGVRVRGVVDGHVDFKTWMDGTEPASLSWKLGEQRISFYCEGEDEDEERKPIHGHRFSRERRAGSSAHRH